MRTLKEYSKDIDDISLCKSCHTMTHTNKKTGRCGNINCKVKKCNYRCTNCKQVFPEQIDVFEHYRIVDHEWGGAERID